MKIAYFTDTYLPQVNGASVSINNFSKRLRAMGHEVYIIAPKLKNQDKKEKDVYRLRSLKVLKAEPEPRLPILLPDKASRDILRLDFDLVHAHGNGAFSLLGYQIAKMKRVPYILTFHTIHSKYAHYFLKGKIIRPKMIERGLRVFASLCDGVVVPSEKMKSELIKYGVKKRIKVVPNFIEYSKFQVENKSLLHKKLQIPSSSPIILSVGRLGKEKNFEFLIHTFKKVAAKNKTVRFVIVGPGVEEQNLKKLVDSLELSDRIHFVGRVEVKDMPYVYADASFFTFASTTETQGVAVLEAAAAGLPMIVVDDLAFKDIVKTGKNGFSLPLREEAFAEKMIELLGDPRLREKFSDSSREIAKKYTDGHFLTRDLIDYYREILKEYGQRDRIFKKIVNSAALVKLINATSTINKFLTR